GILMDRRHRTAGTGVACSAAVLLCIAGCSGEQPVDESGVIRFSEAGVPIVVSTRPELPAGTWRLQSDPLLSVGEIQGAEPYLFDGVAHAHLRPDGGIVVVDRGSSSIRLFDTRGQHIRSTGRPGDGPGEF